MEISERVWKYRFVCPVAVLFEKGGMDSDAAIEIAYHMADDCYLERDKGVSPEDEAYSAYEAIAVGE
ncbi:hypothetical protein [Bradyrhizobium sp. USDA 4452]